jgi:hypothetical protein
MQRQAYPQNQKQTKIISFPSPKKKSIERLRQPLKPTTPHTDNKNIRGEK